MLCLALELVPPLYLNLMAISESIGCAFRGCLFWTAFNSNCFSSRHYGTALQMAAVARPPVTVPYIRYHHLKGKWKKVPSILYGKVISLKVI